jgi:membrane protein DedA with SNARE-associated domain
MMDLDALTVVLLDFVRAHRRWAPFIVGALAFAESLAFLSFLVPSTVLLLGIGALIGASGLDFWPIWLGAAVGAILGDWVSYAIGYRFKHAALRIWPLSRHPGLADRGERFFSRWGAWGVFLGRFIGPLRAVVPLTAGIFAMPMLLVQTANIASAFVWAFVMLAPGTGLTALAR